MIDKMCLQNKVLLGDVREVCHLIPDNFIQSIITSPPYFGHRIYSEEKFNQNEIGREKTLDEYINNLVMCFNAIKPKLKDSGLLWLNMGDTYRNKELLGVPWRERRNKSFRPKKWYSRTGKKWRQF